jgi:hypothetical protein
MTCSKCDLETTGKHGMCAEHWSAYQREYRQRSDTKRDKTAHFRGFTDGVAAASIFLRQTLGDRTASGHQAAQLIERAVMSGAIGGTAIEVTMRRALIQQIGR